MRTETITLRITREDEGDGMTGVLTEPVANWRWHELLDCLPEHVEVIEDNKTTEHAVTYDDAIQVAASLIEPENYEPLAENGGNPEYVRAQVELIYNLFGYQRYGVEPREAVEQDLRKAVMRTGEKP